MRFRMRLTIFIALVVCVVPKCYSSDSFDFKIDDYIPDLYMDAVWQISGNMSASGSRNGRDETSATTTQWYKASGSSSSGYLYLDSRFDRASLSRRSWNRLIGSLRGQLSTDYSEATRNNSSLTEYNSVNMLTTENKEREQSRLDLWGNYASGRHFWKSLSYNLALSLGASLDYTSGLSKSRREEVLWNIPSRLDSIINSNSNDGNRRGNYLYAGSTISLSVGYVYEGRYTAAALHLLSELKRRGLLSRNPTVAEIRILCDTSYAYANMYFADARWRRVATSKALAQTLVNIGLLQSPSSTMLVRMQDIWFGYSHESRQFGAQLTIGITGNGQSRYEKNTHYITDDLTIVTHDFANGDSVTMSSGHTYRIENNRHEFQAIGYRNFLTATTFKPLSLRWQLNSSFSIMTGSHSYVWDDTAPKKETDNWNKQASISVRTSAIYFADSRTTADVTCSGLLQRGRERYVSDDFTFYDESGPEDLRITVVGVSGKLSYWTSDNTQIAGQCIAERRTQHYTSGKFEHRTSNTGMKLSLHVTHFLM